jgi:serine/threonine protein kinase
VATTSVEALVPDLRLGRFEILEQIGRGGFGIVVRARDPQLNRDVAIKIPRFETALSPQSRQRFEREAKAAASLNHPGIVGVFELGSAQGVDFIVNEFIDGENLATHLARGQTFSPKEAAQLVAKIADALEHAHQRGVLHRDIKPSNIMLAEDSSGLKPLVADFGLASISDEHDFTQTGSALGTPAYMSPEQTAGDKEQFGPATDVYGLGTILYELLTGRSPFADLKILEMLDAIRRRDPVSPRTINSDCPRDLESICLKCLEKKSDRRYRSAQELQTDLRRFINDTPVLARPITTVDRGLRWIRRNPVLATVATSALVFLSIALVASVWGWVSTSTALARESDAKNDARATVNQYFTDVAENDLLDVPGLLPLREKLLNSALVYYEQYLVNNSTEQDVLEELELAQVRVGKIQSELGNHHEAIESFEKAIEFQDQILKTKGDDPELAGRHYDTYRQLALSQKHLDQFEKGLASLDFAIAGQRLLVESSPGDARWKYNLFRSLRAKANALKVKGDFQQAIELADESKSILVDLAANEPGNMAYRRDLVALYLEQANSMAKNGDLDGASALIDSAIELARSLVESPNPTSKDIHGLSAALLNRGGKHLMKSEVDLARPLLEEAADWCSHLVVIFPHVAEYRELQLSVYNGLAFCYSRLNLSSKVEEVLRKQIETYTDLVNGPAAVPQNIYSLAVAQMNLGSTLGQQTSQQAEAMDLLTRATGNFDDFLKKSPDFFEAKIASALCELNLAAVCNQVDEHESALNHANRSIELLEEINVSRPGVPQVVQNLANAYHNRADALEFLGRPEEAVPVWRTAVEHGGHFKPRSQLRLASALAQTGELLESRTILEALENEPSTKTRFGGSLGRAQAAMAKAWSESEDVELAQIESLLDRAFESLKFWLEQPQNSKLSNVEKLRTTEVYELLRQRDDFNQWLDEAAQNVETEVEK